MNAMRKALISVFALVLIFSCSKVSQEQGSKKEERTYPVELAKIISYVSNGNINLDENVTVTFTDSVVDDAKVEVPIKKEVFNCNPKIEGVTKFVDNRTIKLFPNSLKKQTKYSCKFDLFKLLGKKEYKTLPVLDIDIETPGLEITNFTGDFFPDRSDNPKNLHYKGFIKFNDIVKEKDVINSMKITKDGRDISFIGSLSKDDPKIFNYRVDGIVRNFLTQEFIVKLSKSDDVAISSDIEKTIELPQMQEFIVREINADTSMDKPFFIINFSDTLSLGQNLKGLITVDNMETPLKVTKNGKDAVVKGDFRHGETYIVRVHKGIESKWGTKTVAYKPQSVVFEDINPQMSFLSDGVFLPSSNNKRVRFKTVNLKKVKVIIKKVFENNLLYFLQNEKLRSDKKNYNGPSSYSLERVGVKVHERDLKIGDEKNKWLQHEIDLSRVMSDKKGLYVVTLSFNREDMLYEKDDSDDSYYGDRYYSNPNSRGYIYRHGEIAKSLILSDIGITAKVGRKNQYVFVTDLISAKPLSNVVVKLKSYHNQLIAQSRTDSQGTATFDKISEKVFLIEAQSNGARSVVKLNDMIWQLSSFDTGGATSSNEGLKAFVYSDRGVYRPGDTWNIGFIARNESGSFPENHPVRMRVYNPKNQKVYEKKVNRSTDGFYVFSYKTNTLDPTGKWQVRFKAGSKEIKKYIKVETVVPYKLKVEVTPSKKHLTSEDTKLDVKVSSKYLVGNPAALSPVDLTMKISNKEKVFSKYKGFRFTDETVDFKEINKVIFKGKLNPVGEKSTTIDIPELKNAPSEVKMTLVGKVFEKGGRPVVNRSVVKIDPNNAYVGVRIPEMDWGYSELNKPVNIKTLLVDSSGNNLPGKQLEVVIYHCSRYWWYEYNDYSKFKKNFRTNYSTSVYKQFSVITRKSPVSFEFTPEKRGNYLIEVRDGSKGHIATGFLKASAWGGGTSERDASVLTIKKDKERYSVGETAFITIPTPEKGQLLFTLEKGSEVIEHKWIVPTGNKTTIPIDLNKKMVPNIYATVSIIQPHDQTVNDRPIRMYGITPIIVDDKETKQKIDIIVNDFLRPEKDFSVTVKTDRPGSQITIAVVDEGLLGLTDFKTPDPWKFFFSKERLSVLSYDLFDDVLGAHQGSVANKYSIGGDLALKYKKLQLAAKQAKRFKPVAMFKGPFKANSSGVVKADFKMPNYVGAVRVMAVSAKNDTYGSASKEVKVKNELMVLPYLPRFISAGDSFTFPVSVFAMNSEIKNVDVKIKVEGPIKIIGKEAKVLNFKVEGEQSIEFSAESLNEVGISKITVIAKSGKYRAEKVIELDIRPPSSRIYETVKEVKSPGEKIVMKIPDKGIKGTNNVMLRVSKRPDIKIQHRLNWLIRYPYGCVEQTVSSVFPQLYLKEFLKKGQSLKKVVDKNINAGINRLVNFQTYSGGFSYWPGNKEASYWGTNYAGHFLIEAKNRGYHVPAHLFDNWVKFERSQAVSQKHGLLMRTYIVYLLALAGKPEMSAMNQLKEGFLNEMEDREKWLLAASYFLSGNKKVAKEIERSAGTSTSNYREFSHTYGSGLRDKAIIMNCSQTLKNEKVNRELFEYLGEHLSKDSWYSTQTTAFVLLAVGKYLESNKKGEEELITGSVKFPDGTKESFKVEKGSYLKVLKDFGKNVEVSIDNSSTAKRAYITMSWDGIPIEPTMCKADKLYMKREFLDDDGYKIYPSKIKQGQSFWMHLTGSLESDIYHRVDEIALQVLLPGGWEIENTRLSNEQLPEWMRIMKLGKEEYLDIRDDRVIWFFDLPNRRDYDFVVKVNAVTKGDFIMPLTTMEAMYDHSYQTCTVPMRVVVE